MSSIPTRILGLLRGACIRIRTKSHKRLYFGVKIRALQEKLNKMQSIPFASSLQRDVLGTKRGRITVNPRTLNPTVSDLQAPPRSQTLPPGVGTGSGNELEHLVWHVI